MLDAYATDNTIDTRLSWHPSKVCVCTWGCGVRWGERLCEGLVTQTPVVLVPPSERVPTPL